MTAEELEHAISNLTFGVIKSVRYHDRRSDFFNIAHKFTSFLTVLMAGAIIFQIDAEGKGGDTALVVGWAAALFAGADVVIGFANMAGLHKALKNRFIDLQCELQNADVTEKKYKALNERRLRIESDEPTPYRALDVMCRNDVILAGGFEADIKILPWYVRYSAHIHKWPNIGTRIKIEETKTKQSSCGDT